MVYFNSTLSRRTTYYIIYIMNLFSYLASFFIKKFSWVRAYWRLLKKNRIFIRFCFSVKSSFLPAVCSFYFSNPLIFTSKMHLWDITHRVLLQSIVTHVLKTQSPSVVFGVCKVLLFSTWVSLCSHNPSSFDFFHYLHTKAFSLTTALRTFKPNHWFSILFWVYSTIYTCRFWVVSQ